MVGWGGCSRLSLPSLLVDAASPRNCWGTKMNAITAESEFQRFIALHGRSVSELGVDEGITLALAFYQDHRAEHSPPDSDGDMMPFQWGTYDWGKGEWFGFDLTRQFILNNEPQDENIWQLSLTFKFSPSAQLRSLGSGEKWCYTPRTTAVEYFQGFIRNTEAFQSVRDFRPQSVDLDFECAG